MFLGHIKNIGSKSGKLMQLFINYCNYILQVMPWSPIIYCSFHWGFFCFFFVKTSNTFSDMLMHHRAWRGWTGISDLQGGLCWEVDGGKGLLEEWCLWWGAFGVGSAAVWLCSAVLLFALHFSAGDGLFHSLAVTRPAREGEGFSYQCRWQFLTWAVYGLW